MGSDSRAHGCRDATLQSKVERRTTLASVVTGLVLLASAVPVDTSAQQSAAAIAASPLVFDGVTVVDVEHGKLLPDQRVVIAGNRIQAVGESRAVKLPQQAQVVDARGRYLIPGLWDLHVHPGVTDDADPLGASGETTDVFYPLFVANGVTGIRDAWSSVPPQTQLQWWHEVVAGTRVGPPRQLISGWTLGKSDYDEQISLEEAQRRVDTLKALGVNFLKVYWFTFEYAAAARRAGLPFGGHMDGGAATIIGHTRVDLSGDTTPAVQASDSGMRIFDHMGASHLSGRCFDDSASVDICQPIATRFQRNGSWLVPTIIVDGGYYASLMTADLSARAREFWAGALLHGNWLRDSLRPGPPYLSEVPPDSLGRMRVLQRTGMPILAGSDIAARDRHQQLPGFMLHAELAAYVAEGLAPLAALQSATLNPAKLLNATDSMGTVAPGKLADLVLLDADPLADITNTTTIRAVVANGRYYDRAALDGLLTGVQAKARKQP